MLSFLLLAAASLTPCCFSFCSRLPGDENATTPVAINPTAKKVHCNGPSPSPEAALPAAPRYT